MATDIATGYYGNYDQAMVGLPCERISRSRYFVTANANLTNAVEYKVMRLPADCVVINVITTVTTAEGTATLDIGSDTAGATKFEDDADLANTGVTQSIDATLHVTALDWLTITSDEVLNTCVFAVTVEYIMVDSSMTAVKIGGNN